MRTPELWNQDYCVKAVWPPSRAEEVQPVQESVPSRHLNVETLLSLSRKAQLSLRIICHDEWSHRGYPIKNGKIHTLAVLDELCDAGLIFLCGSNMDDGMRRRLPLYKLKPITVALAAEAGWVTL